MCNVNYRFFPKILPDNDMNFLQHLFGIINSVDELSSLEITKNTNSYRFRLAPSLPKYIPMLLEEILKFHNMFRIKLDLSKSIKSSGTIVFEITLNEQ
jgi:hypothetical protein